MAVSPPLEQFVVRPLVPLHLGGYDISMTNSTVWMLAGIVVATLFFMIGMRKEALVPGRLQSLTEMIYGMAAGMVRDNVGHDGLKYLPLIFSLFVFVLFGNLLGLIPFSFTYTSHIVVTFGMAIVIFLAVTVIGFSRHGLGYFRMFFPHGAPLWTAVILVPIELISYLSRPISLSVRLFANMTAGHVMLAVIAGFVALLGIWGVLPIALLVAITALEFMIAVIQAYVFAILTCVYLNDALHMH